MPTSLLDVQARWGYSEIADSNFSPLYGDSAAIVALRIKRRAGVPFDQLLPTERRELAHACAWVRQNLFVAFKGIEQFEVAPLVRAELGRLLVPPNVWRDSGGCFYPFSHYIATTTNETGDARLLGPPPNRYQSPIDPLTLGRFDGHLVLIDGYHRAALFWKYGPSDGAVAAYMPIA
jgi:hypothetical protein